MLSRRNMLRSVGLTGAAVAVSPLLGGCGKATSPAVGPGGGVGAVALADVPRSLGDVSARPEAAASVRAFTADLYTRLATKPGNLVCSPYSVAVALAMTRNGARGRTASELDAVLHDTGLLELNEGLDSLSRLVESRGGQVKRADGSTGMVSLDVANSLWGQHGTRWGKPFLTALARYYGTGMRLVDYAHDPEAARVLIDAWTADRTHGRIPEIIPAGMLDTLTRLVLVNAIYLKAAWEESFRSDQTRSAQFTRADGSHVDVEMMSANPSLASYGSGAGWQAVRLPYVGGQLAMTVVLPATSMDALDASLDAEALTAILRSPQPTEQLILTLPRWTFRQTATLNAVLAALGMPTAFDPARADFSAMAPQEDLYIRAVLHQAFISVDEHGTEAAAATAVIMEALSGSSVPPQVMNVDRPFLFVIHDVETATPLFIGRVDDPTAT